jgi:hypothetical protein
MTFAVHGYARCARRRGGLEVFRGAQPGVSSGDWKVAGFCRRAPLCSWVRKRALDAQHESKSCSRCALRTLRPERWLRSSSYLGYRRLHVSRACRCGLSSDVREGSAECVGSVATCRAVLASSRIATSSTRTTSTARVQHKISVIHATRPTAQVLFHASAASATRNIRCTRALVSSGPPLMHGAQQSLRSSGSTR